MIPHIILPYFNRRWIFGNWSCAESSLHFDHPRNSSWTEQREGKWYRWMEFSWDCSYFRLYSWSGSSERKRRQEKSVEFSQALISFSLRFCKLPKRWFPFRSNIKTFQSIDSTTRKFWFPFPSISFFISFSKRDHTFLLLPEQKNIYFT